MKYNCVKQHDTTDCGPACLATVCKQYGLITSVSRIREVAGTDTNGTNAYGMLKAADDLGFTARAVKGSLNDLFSGIPLPAIANVVMDGILLHYVVIHKITDKEIIIANPAKGIEKMSPDAFSKIWTGVLFLLMPNEQFKKGRETKSIFERFLGLLKPNVRLMVLIVGASLILAAIGIISTYYFRIIIDKIIPESAVGLLTAVSLGLIAVKLFAVILSMIRTRLVVILSQKLDRDLLLGYYKHVIKLPMKFFGSRKVGEIIARFQDASFIRDALSNTTLTVIIDVLMATAGAVILCVNNTLLFSIALFMVALYAVLVAIYNKPYKKTNEKQMEENAQLTSYLVESLNGIQTVKAYCGENKIWTETENRFIKLQKTGFKLAGIINMQEGLKSIVEVIGGTAIIWIGANNVIQGNMTIGGLISFNALLSFFLEPIRSLIDIQPSLQTAIVASERLGEVLDMKPEKETSQNGKEKPECLMGDISIQDISFRYGTRELIFKHLSMDIKAGDHVAIVGQSGAGKTTIAKLLLNMYQCEEGLITVGGTALSDISLDVLRKKIAYVSQETFLFSGTIMDNLTFGADNPNTEEVMRIAQMTQVDQFVQELPLKYETHLEENGSNLSGGQKQRIAIARALIMNPDILILDEATSNLDVITEMMIQKTIDEYSSNMTTIIIAHRISTIRNCDKIYVMDHGMIIESGSHQELMERKDGFYRGFYERQVGKYEEN